MRDPDNVAYHVPIQILSGTGLVVSAGIVGWTLRGGALISALLSSMPVWRGFDPLAVVMQPKQKDKKKRQPNSQVDRMFDEVSKADESARGVAQ